jgi:hypothetical protein
MTKKIRWPKDTPWVYIQKEAIHKEFPGKWEQFRWFYVARFGDEGATLMGRLFDEIYLPSKRLCELPIETAIKLLSQRMRPNPRLDNFRLKNNDK